MRNTLAIVAIASLLGLSPAVAAEAGSDSESQPGMDKSQASGQTIKTEVVEIDGERIITQTKNGEQLVFSVEGATRQFKVGDELELMVDEQSNTGVILHVTPQDERGGS